MRGAAPGYANCVGAFLDRHDYLAAQHADEVVLNLASPFRKSGGFVRATMAPPRPAAPRLTVWAPGQPWCGRALPAGSFSWRCTSPRPAMAKCSVRWALTAWSVARGPSSLRRELAVAVQLNCSTGCVLGSPDRRARPAPTRMPVPIAPRSCPPPDPGAGWFRERCDLAWPYGTAGDNDGRR